MKLAVVCLAACGGAAHPATTSEAPETVAASMVDAFSNNSSLVTPDGHVVFISNRDGLPLLYVGELAHPATPPRKLPTGTERVASPSLMPDGKTIVFLSDVGANQKFHVFAIGIDGSHLVDLTPGDEQRRASLQVARASGQLFYTSHTLEDETTHVFVQTLDGPPREIYKDPRSGYILDVTPDGSRLLFLSAISDTNKVLVFVDTEAAAAHGMMFGKQHDLDISDAKFASNGKTIIMSTEDRGRPTHIVRLDATTSEELAHYDEPTAVHAATNSIMVSPRGDKVVVELDAGDHIELRMLDATTLQAMPLPSLPLATFAVGQFTSDGAMLTMNELGTAGPSDIVALDMSTGVVKPLRDEPRKGLGAPPHASIEKLRAFDGLELPVNLYMPAGPVQPRPVFVLVHGGPSGSALIQWSPSIGFWTAMGFVVVAPNIRGSTGFGIEYQMADDREHRADALHDMETINTWIRAQPWCDPHRIVIGGISYGGYMTLLAVARQPKLWAAGVDGSGMSNLVTMEQLEDQAIRRFDDTEFGILGKDDALLREWSPLTYVANITSPVFVYQGVGDPVTPQHEADQIVEALKRRNVPVEYMLVANEGHGLTRRENTVSYLARSYRFVTSQLQH